ncbi:somatostatin receptor type 2-like [Saccoglossus kowalevskii]|uniref:Somatostatin receptor type 2-like n=1 Tax=Saccoglossus kowalevskii TaxID=10224 RepID=A0ABM0GKE0_SACKO|nr:PREDICTED: somatostatin receptor type 2-like [Saccoglossus kowalevskii]
MESYGNDTVYDIFTLMVNSTDNRDTSVKADKIILSILWAIACVVGLIGNSLVIYVILRFSKMKTVTNTYILNLAIADELYLLGIPFSISHFVMETWPYGTAWCKILLTNDIINQFASIYFLTVMSIDRYIAVVHPVKSVNIRTPRIANAVSGCVWALVLILVSWFTAAVRSDYDERMGSYGCGPNWIFLFGNSTLDQEDWGLVFSYFTFMMGYIIPLLIICTAYILMLNRLRQVGAPGSKGKKTRKVTKLVTVVVGVFFICWSPYYILNVAMHYAVMHSKAAFYKWRIAYYFAQSLGYANSSANPILYAFLSDNFKKSFQKAFACATDLQIEMSVSHFRKPSNKRKHLRSQETDVTNSMNMKNCQTHAIMLSDSPTNGKLGKSDGDPEPVQL